MFILQACLGGGDSSVSITPCGKEIEVPDPGEDRARDRPGTYAGPVCIDAVAVRVLSATDRCLGNASIVIDDQGAMYGEGECAFEGEAGSISIKPFLPDSYGGSLTGTVDDADSASGEIDVRTGWGEFGSEWTGSFVGEALVGNFSGQQILQQDNTIIDLTFNGTFVVLPVQEFDTGENG